MDNLVLHEVPKDPSLLVKTCWFCKSIPSRFATYLIRSSPKAHFSLPRFAPHPLRNCLRLLAIHCHRSMMHMCGLETSKARRIVSRNDSQKLSTPNRHLWKKNLGDFFNPFSPLSKMSGQWSEPILMTVDNVDKGKRVSYVCETNTQSSTERIREAWLLVQVEWAPARIISFSNKPTRTTLNRRTLGQFVVASDFILRPTEKVEVAPNQKDFYGLLCASTITGWFFSCLILFSLCLALWILPLKSVLFPYHLLIPCVWNIHSVKGNIYVDITLMWQFCQVSLCYLSLCEYCVDVRAFFLATCFCLCLAIWVLQ
jgi:hypothetical protein